MKTQFKTMFAVAATAAAVSAFWLAQDATEVQAQNGMSSAQIPRTPDGKPNLNGIWQTMNAANWSLEPAEARHGPLAALEAGAHLAFPPSVGYVEGGTIPYKDGMREQQQENMRNWLQRDPTTQCKLPGVPRATYLPYPFQIFQAPDATLISYQFAGADRIVHMDRPDLEAQVDSWMGHNNGSWDGDTLVIDVTGQIADTWFDRSGHYHSGWDMHVQERYTMVDANTIDYSATITDPNTFEEPWTINMKLYRHQDDNAMLLEFKCVEFVEELIYGHLRAPGDPIGDGVTPIY
ncbi:hypothetical protein QGM61_10035 [Pseudohongiella sp. SYSU M77423]|uniref:hypothetical protein n=1 Tax=unclassified Pseudohongiella TaxID=2629611 RepID=UPI001F40B265|nr:MULTISPECIES: hypothetical protein [unclassified Pseudohongiella]MDH7944156.1 hypothetical protein [Pseudohongiella sp. SYSU M77423]MEC8859362.1 hypothetical protein [Pseudomonadota bacterium]|tara:strand:+ start:417 stop:1292 length:876 start_codon:yes stop_codon:yes gene_type:complete